MAEHNNGPRANVQKSVHDLPPIETGGTVARRGFGLQDHVAAGFCIHALRDVQLKAVWCESYDDVTLIWATASGDIAEFVQVKSNELTGLWSVAKLCEREVKSADAAESPTKSGEKRAGRRVKTVGTSILERSLANDRCKEQCRFRIVTSWPVDGDIRVLTYELSCEYRVQSAELIARLTTKLKLYVGDYASPNGNDCEFWAHHTLWDCVGQIDDVTNRNLLSLSRLVAELDCFVPTDQLEEVYAKLVSLVSYAAAAVWKNNREAKKLTREKLQSWLTRTLDALRPLPKGGQRLREKMRKAHLPEDSIQAALEERNRYRQEILQRHVTLVPRSIA